MAGLAMQQRPIEAYLNSIFFAVVVIDGFHDRHARRIMQFSEFDMTVAKAEKLAMALQKDSLVRIVISAIRSDGSYRHIEQSDWQQFSDMMKKKPPALSVRK